MDKRILTKKFLIYTNAYLKLFSLLGEISFLKKDHLSADIDPELIWWLIFLTVNFPQFSKISVLS